MIEYLPYEQRTPDTQYQDLLRRILEDGERIPVQQGGESVRIIGHQMRFPLANGFPIISERDMLTEVAPGESPFLWALREHIAFLHGARTQEELEGWGVRFWKPWVTEAKCSKRGLETGDLGPGSYGPSWRSFPTAEGEPFDQITETLIEQLGELPHLRTHLVSPWIPQYIGRGKGKIQKVVVVPCHGWVHILVNTYTRELTLHHFQRSADSPVGLVFNVSQYSALALMLARVHGFVAKELVYTISDAHFYLDPESDNDQTPAIVEMLNAEPKRFPTVTIDPDVTNLFDFRAEHFKVEDYEASLPWERIWTPV